MSHMVHTQDIHLPIASENQTTITYFHTEWPILHFHVYRMMQDFPSLGTVQNCLPAPLELSSFPGLPSV